MSKFWQLLLGIALVAALALSGCGRKHDGQNAAVGRPELSDGLCIVPEAAYANHVLKAGALTFAAQFDGGNRGTNSRGESLRWLVNGTEVARSFELEPGKFRRGDVVELQRIKRVIGGPTNSAPQILERDQTVILNSAPRITAVILDRARENGAYLECRVHADDADADALQVEYEWLLNGKRMVGAAGELAALHDVEKNSRIEVNVIVSDGHDKSTPFRSRSYVVDNLPPRLQVPATATVNAQKDGTRKVSFTIAATDPDGDEIDVSMEGAPSDAQYDRKSGLVSWIVNGPVAETVVTVRANDGKGATVEHELRIAAEDVTSR